MDASGAVAVSALSFVMFLASFGAGSVPLLMSLGGQQRQQRMNMVGSLAIGLLVGTGLGVVLPEGIETLYSATEPEPVSTAPQSTADHHSERSHHLAIALTLVAGYLVMHLLTFLPPLFLHNHVESPIPLASLPSTPRLERPTSSGTTYISDSATGLSNTTIGLSIHALADGIALGSSAVADNIALEGLVFFAIMLHKAPASFSLTAILLRESYPRISARRQLLLFALSSPVATVTTYFALSAISLNQLNVQYWSGIFLLFSAGTLIFASTNVHIHAAEEEQEKVTVTKTEVSDILISAVGMCIPLFLATLGHGH